MTKEQAHVWHALGQLERLRDEQSRIVASLHELISSLREDRERLVQQVREQREEIARLTLERATNGQKRASKVKIANVRQAYDSLDRPSARKVAELCGYDRNSPEFKAAYAQVEGE